MRLVVSLLCGILFGAGLTISQMVSPNKVLMFLDLFGDWDPSLAFVMIGGISIFSLGFFFIINKRTKPVLAAQFSLPVNTTVDNKLIIGAIIFGLGWGMTGICPGPAIANVSGGNAKIYGFIIMMIIGMQSVRLFTSKRDKN